MALISRNGLFDVTEGFGGTTVTEPPPVSTAAIHCSRRGGMALGVMRS